MVNRINLILRTKNLSPSQFADEIGVQRSSMSHILSGRNNPSLEFITKVLARFPELQTDWLIFGKGAMYKDTIAEKAEDIKIPDRAPLSEHDLFSQSDEENILNESIPDKNDEFDDAKNIPSQNLIFTSSPQEKKIYEAVKNEKTIEKFVILYTDKTFCEYFPEE